MEILKLTANDFKDGKYVNGKIAFNGHVEIESNLGYVVFTSIQVTG